MKKRKVYSYLRFSTPEQAMGDSERRQFERAKEWVNQRPHLVLDESIVDRGISAYKGQHIALGNLSKLLDKIEDGTIERGSILLIENVDRLSRQEPMQAFDLIRKLVKKDITIQTLVPEVYYDEKALNGNEIYGLLGQMQRAHGESVNKADRQKRAWDHKRQLAAQGRFITRSCPNWLKPVNVKRDDSGRVFEGSYEIVPGAAETIDFIFRKYLDGWSPYLIEKYLNKNGLWVPEKRRKRETGGWRVSYVRKILRSRAVIGELQPRIVQSRKIDGVEVSRKEPIDGEVWKDYYPAVVNRDLWHAVQEKLGPKQPMREKQKFAGRRGKALNVFRHMVRCHSCGGPLHLRDYNRPHPVCSLYLKCDSHRRQLVNSEGKPKCDAGGIRFQEVRDVILNHLTNLKPELVLPNKDEVSKRIKAIHDLISGIDGELQEKERAIEHLTNSLTTASNKEFVELVQKKFELLVSEKKSLEEERIKLKSEGDRLGEGAKDLSRWKANLKELIKVIDDEDPGPRIALNNHLSQFIELIAIVQDEQDGKKVITVTIVEKVRSLPPEQKSFVLGDLRYTSPEGKKVQYMNKDYEIFFHSASFTDAAEVASFYRS
jgi:DNA invertase Pin-like site-specific DNA recombinase